MGALRTADLSTRVMGLFSAAKRGLAPEQSSGGLRLGIGPLIGIGGANPGRTRAECGTGPPRAPVLTRRWLDSHKWKPLGASTLPRRLRFLARRSRVPNALCSGGLRRHQGPTSGRRGYGAHGGRALAPLIEALRVRAPEGSPISSRWVGPGATGPPDRWWLCRGTDARRGRHGMRLERGRRSADVGHAHCWQYSGRISQRVANQRPL